MLPEKKRKNTPKGLIIKKLKYFMSDFKNNPIFSKTFAIKIFYVSDTNNI